MRVRPAILVAFALALAPCARAPAGPTQARPLPRPAHVVVVIEENKTLAQIVDSGSAPYLNALVRRGALFTDSHGVAHPSLPNYFALFAGLTNDNGDGCPATGIPATAPNLGSELFAAHRSFAGYSEGLPYPGFRGCAAGQYARKHAPWVHFSNVPASANLPLAQLPAPSALPTVAIIVPDLDDDMHDGTVKEGDDWLVRHLAGLLSWAGKNDTLVIVTWDEGFDRSNTIPTIFAGPMVKAGRYGEHVTHYRVLRTIEDLLGLAPSGRAADVAPIADVWR
ncbi:MAG TPA: alkaline phosphatase family protein [Candidatus Baltobacteraceae bacterium]|nr:alkaline phosphatase family protein [Candidatus Baltobacteraceae bacterium]